MDNINKRSSYASVKSSDTSRGFAGTSVQLVEPQPDSIKLHCQEKSKFLQNGQQIKCYSGLSFRKIHVHSDMSLYRCLVNLTYFDIRSSQRSDDGQILCAEKNEKESVIAELFQTTEGELIWSFYKSDFYDVIPDEVYYLACIHILGCSINIFERCSSSDNVTLRFEANYFGLREETNPNRNKQFYSLKESINGETLYSPLFTCKNYFDQNLIPDDYPSFFDGVISNQLTERFSRHVSMAIKQGFRPQKPLQRSVDLSGNLIHQFSGLNLASKFKCNEGFQIPSFSECFEESSSEIRSSAEVKTKAFSFNMMKYISKKRSW